MGLVDSVRSSLEAVDSADTDVAVIDLALQYALLIDEEGVEALPTVGPKLLSCLDALCLTPKSRASITKELERDPIPSPLDELKRKRAERTGSD